MKNLLTLIFVLYIGMNLQAQKIQSSNYTTMYTISSDGKIQDSSYRTLGYIQNGTIQDSSYRTIGYIRDGKIEDASYRTVGYINQDGRVQDSSYRTLGYIDKEGKVQDSSYRVLGYANGINREWTAILFFFFQMEK